MARTDCTVVRARLGPSRILAWLVAAGYGGAVACAIVADIPGAVTAVIAVGALWLMARDLALYAWLVHADAIVELLHQADGRWRLHARDGRVILASLRSPVYVHPWVVALLFETGSGRCVRVPIPRDMLDPETFRQLRVIVRTRR